MLMPADPGLPIKLTTQYIITATLSIVLATPWIVSAFIISATKKGTRGALDPPRRCKVDLRRCKLYIRRCKSRFSRIECTLGSQILQWSQFFLRATLLSRQNQLYELRNISEFSWNWVLGQRDELLCFLSGLSVFTIKYFFAPKYFSFCRQNVIILVSYINHIREGFKKEEFSTNQGGVRGGNFHITVEVAKFSFFIF